jgi:hypothetical protein
MRPGWSPARAPDNLPDHWRGLKAEIYEGKPRMRNPEKSRFLDAAGHIEAQEIPLFEIGPDMALARQILGIALPMDRLVFELPIPDYIELNRRMGNDMIFFPTAGGWAASSGWTLRGVSTISMG